MEPLTTDERVRGSMLGVPLVQQGERGLVLGHGSYTQNCCHNYDLPSHRRLPIDADVRRIFPTTLLNVGFSRLFHVGTRAPAVRSIRAS